MKELSPVWGIINEVKLAFCIIKISAFKKGAEIRSGSGSAPGMAFFIAAASVSHLDIDSTNEAVCVEISSLLHYRAS